MRTKPNFKTFAVSAGVALGLSCAILPASLWAQSGSPDGARTADGFIVKNGQIYQLRNGQATPLGQDAVMRITPAGEITGFDGQQRRLNENTVLTMDGRVLPAPPGVVFSAPQPGPGDSQVEDRFSQSRTPQRAVAGENLSGLATGSASRQTPASNAQAQGEGQAQPSAFNTVAPTGDMRRSSDRGGDNTYGNTGGIVDPVTGLPIVVGNSGTPVAGTNQNQNTTTTATQAGNPNTATSSGNANTSNTSNVNAANGIQSGAANSSTSTSTNPNASGATSAQQPQGGQAQQPQGFSRQGVGTNSSPINGSGASGSSASGPESRTNSTNATQGGNGPTDRVNSSNASGAGTGGNSGSARSSGTSGSGGSSSSSGGASSGGSSGGGAGSGSGSGSSGGGSSGGAGGAAR